MEGQPPGCITSILQAAEAGDAAAQDRLWSVVYAELRELAHRYLRHDAAGRQLQTTGLVHEAYLRLVGDNGDVNWENRRHFFAAAAQAMRRILVDEARRLSRLKRGRGQRAQPLPELSAEVALDPGEVLALDEALGRLEREAPRAARVVALRYYAGLSIDEVAGVLAVSSGCVDGDWRFARTWLHSELSRGREVQGGA